MQKMFKSTPDKFMALGAASLQVWAKAANEVKSLDKEKVAKKIRGGSFKDTVFGDVSFQPNGQMNSSYYLFVVKDQKIVIQSGNK
jgi:branched-chain amino acid transport system substrate-binding protein